MAVIRLCRKIPSMFPILRELINPQYTFQYLGELGANPQGVLTGLAGRRKCSTSQQPSSKPLFDRKMTPKSLLLTSKRAPPKVISQSLINNQSIKTSFQINWDISLPRLTARPSEMFCFTPSLYFDPKNTRFCGRPIPNNYSNT
jgi:hypothetical protein